MQKVLFDLEFTGLDNEIISDNEIICLKLYNLSNNESVFKTFSSKKPLGATAQIMTGMCSYGYIGSPVFNNEEFYSALNEIGVNTDCEENRFKEDIQLIGFSIKQDLLMLKKYEIGLYRLKTLDLQDYFRCTYFALRMATEGSSLEATHLIVTGKTMRIEHGANYDEIIAIKNLYEVNINTPSDLAFMRFVPFGPFAGMPIRDYVIEHRRMADGYRFNNYDCYSLSLDNAIKELEYVDEDDYYDDDEEYFEDEELEEN